MAYAAKDITVLRGLEPVRERPGMYIGSTGPSGLHHLVYEVVDNAVDEALAGYCTRIDVALLADGGCRVTDNGRGIPVDNHRELSREVGGRGCDDHAPLGREVRRRGLQDLRWSTRRRRVGRQRVVEQARARHSTRRLPLDPDLCEGRRAPGEAREEQALEEDRHHGHLLARRDGVRGDRLPRADTARALARDGVSQQGLGDPLRRRAPRPAAAADVPVQRRHRRFREAPQREQGATVQAGGLVRGGLRGKRDRDRDAVEHRLLRGDPLVRQQHRHHRGWDARGGVQEGPHQCGQ